MVIKSILQKDLLFNKTINTNEDIEAAYAVIDNRADPALADNYINSQVYITTNEVLARYEHLFQDRKTMLSVVASGEQILSAILAGVESIDAFDISRFPKYFLYLKKAAIQGLTPDEYYKFFHTYVNYTSLQEHDIYFPYYRDKIRQYLDKEALNFWDFLFSRYSWNMIRYKLARTVYVSPEFQVENNRFLQQKYYLELRDRLKDSEINFKTGDIRDLAATYQSEYDLIYLSNIHSYIKLVGLKELTQKLKTTKDGVMILGVVEGKMGKHGVGNFDFRHLNGQPYTFTRHNGYITGKKKSGGF